MAVVSSHFWFDHHFGLSLCCDASCLPFVFSWLALFSGLAGFCLVSLTWPSGSLYHGVAPLVSIWAALYCMSVIGSHFWLGRCFGSSLCCDPSGFGRFFPAPSLDASAPHSMLEVDRVVLSAVGFLFVLPWWGRHDIRGVSSWECPSFSSLDVATMLTLVNLLEPSPCSLGCWLGVCKCICIRNLTFTLT